MTTEKTPEVPVDQLTSIMQRHYSAILLPVLNELQLYAWFRRKF